MATIEIGIDLGTTNSSVAIIQQNKVQIFKNALSEESIPSIMYADSNGNIVVGSKTKHIMINSRENLQNSKAEIKRQLSTAENVCMKIKLFIIFCAALCFYQGLVFADSDPAEPGTQAFLSEYYYSPERSQQGYSKLLYAVEKGYRTIALKLLESGENPNYTFQVGNCKTSTPFILAVYKEDEELVAAMINNGANANLIAYLTLPDGGEFLPPLVVAVRSNKSGNITQMLCDAGIVDHNARQRALELSFRNADATKFIIIAETIPNAYIENPLLTSVVGCSSLLQKENILKMTQYLIERGFPLQNEESSALALAIRSGNRELVEYLLSLGADVNYIPTSSWRDYEILYNPLFAAIHYLHVGRRIVVSPKPICDKFMAPEMESLSMLLDAGAEVNFSMKRYIHPIYEHLRYEGYSPLTYSIKNHLIDATVLLIAYGADVDMLDNSGKTPLIWAVEMNDVTTVKLLLSSGANILQTGKDGRTPIDVACSLKYTPWAPARYKPVLDALIEAEATLFDGW